MFEKVSFKNSSFIKGAGYNDNQLTVRMNNREYTYPVNTETFIEFLFSESKGKFYNQNIKHKKAI